uniref:Uncharacterized protein n=1 Tax=Arundo donax TaxID=35708 RepID=A0A0A8YFB8_ARUDO
MLHNWNIIVVLADSLYLMFRVHSLKGQKMFLRNRHMHCKQLRVTCISFKHLLYHQYCTFSP